MDSAGYLYPWDVVGDPAAAELVAGLGLDHVTLAAVYHATRALTPRHPEHRVVVAERSAAYYPVGEDRWRGAALRPARAGWLPGDDPFGAATGALRAAGVAVHAWVVVGHVDLPGTPEGAVVNAYGDRYPWALCPAQDPVAEYALGLAGDVAGLPGIEGVELESCGWYGWDHLHAHDKVAGVQLSAAEQYLFSLCFCDACDGAYRAGGVDPIGLRSQVRAGLEVAFRGERDPGTAETAELAEIDRLLGAELAGAVLAVRLTVADRLRAAVVGRIRAERPDLRILLHASPQPQRSTAFTGVDPGRVAGLVDGLVVNCWAGPEPLGPALAGGVPGYASLLAVAGMGGRRTSLVDQAAAARAAGASGIRLYHAGLAGTADLAAVRELAGWLGKEDWLGKEE